MKITAKHSRRVVHRCTNTHSHSRFYTERYRRYQWCVCGSVLKSPEENLSPPSVPLVVWWCGLRRRPGGWGLEAKRISRENGCMSHRVEFGTWRGSQRGVMYTSVPYFSYTFTIFTKLISFLMAVCTDLCIIKILLRCESVVVGFFFCSIYFFAELPGVWQKLYDAFYRCLSLIFSSESLNGRHFWCTKCCSLVIMFY